MIGTQSYTTSHAHDLADNVTGITYPSGRIVTYARDAMGRVVTVTTKADALATPVTVADNIAYEPFGPLAALDFGNGQTATLSHDADYRLTGIATTDVSTDVQDLVLGHDAASNVTSIDDVLDIARDQGFGYDALHRLTSATGAYGSITYGYDATGNRTSRTIGAVTETSTIAAASNRLTQIADGATTRTLGYDSAGNLTTDTTGSTTTTIAYANDNRPSAVTASGLSHAGS